MNKSNSDNPVRQTDGESTEELIWQPPQGPWSLEIGSPQAASCSLLMMGSSVTLGSGSEVDIRVDDPTISSSHVRVTATPRGLHLEDLGSRNGLFVGQARVVSATLSGGDSGFVIGRTQVTICERSQDQIPKAGSPIPGIVGGSISMIQLAEEIRLHARLRRPVLIQGESGTGKDLVASALHQLSERGGRYVALNVGAIVESLADAELFGHRRGAFTGAVEGRAGAFEQAHQGTLFLDEIAELPPSMQVKLLRVVEDGLVRPIGGTQPIPVDVRVVSASWASLDEQVANGRFRSDLYHRLSTLTIHLVPLRKRKSDIPALSYHLLQRMEDEMGPRSLTSGAIARLAAYAWPGNVRELGSVLYRAALLSKSREIDAPHITAALPTPPSARGVTLTPDEAVELLRQYKGNTSAAARAARVARSTFRAWLEKSTHKEEVVSNNGKRTMIAHSSALGLGAKNDRLD